mmetsp:Transcript_12052/g.17304  ORF Transcript_12052/g.17304 Transcript_12052/m.17304 type:complete len:134 (+) Transcript_12052:51-452(+)
MCYAGPDGNDKASTAFPSIWRTHVFECKDTTNIPYPDPNSGDLNRALHNMCCAKAGIAAQLCCWIYGLPLVTGHSDDDKQINDTQILRQQQEFGDMDSCVANLTKQTKTLWDLQYCERHAWRLCGLAMNELLR